MQKCSLENQSVIVTGAARGIGRALAVSLSAAGARLIVNDLDEQLLEDLVEEIRRCGREVVSVAGSVADWSVAESLVNKAVECYGQLDGLVNNAGLHYSAEPWLEHPDKIKNLYEVNVLGATYCGVNALKIMVAQRHGAIVNLSSGAHLGVEKQATYSASKGAVASLTYGWSIDAAPYGVRVNAIAPLAHTRMTEALTQYNTSAQRNTSQNADVNAHQVDVNQPESIAPLVEYLLSDFSAQISGQLIRFDGEALSILRHPQISDKHYHDSDWDLYKVSEVFSQLGNDGLEPVGLVAGRYVSPVVSS